MAKNRKNKSNILGGIVALLVVIVIALVVALIIKIKNSNEAEEGQEAVEQTDQATEVVAPSAFVHPSDFMIMPNEQGVPVAQINIDFNELKKANADAIGWIYVPECGVNCSIVYSEDNPDYYLTNDITGLNGVFMQNYNNSDFNDRMSVIYGKNQNGKSQFEGLLKYQDKSFFDGHRYIYVATENKLLTYKVFAARKAYAEHLMVGYDWSADQVFLDYLIYILNADEISATTDVETAIDIDSNANIDSSIDVSVNDKVITLSERIVGEDNYRYLVQGVLVNESIKEAP